MERLEPVDALVYVYYKCTKCGEVGDSMRVNEVKKRTAEHECMFCGNVDRVKPVRKVKLEYWRDRPHNNVIKPHSKCTSTKVIPESSLWREGISTMQKMGYSKTELTGAVGNLMKQYPIELTSLDEVVKLIILELDNEQPKTN